jgi:hypothetical protein
MEEVEVEAKEENGLVNLLAGVAAVVDLVIDGSSDLRILYDIVPSSVFTRRVLRWGKRNFGSEFYSLNATVTLLNFQDSANDSLVWDLQHLNRMKNQSKKREIIQEKLLSSHLEIRIRPS